MQVGFNYPWDAYGTDFGENRYFPHDRSHDASWRSTLDQNLVRLHALGIRIVRWFILANGLNYGPDPTPVRPAGLTSFYAISGQGQWSFNPPAAVAQPIVNHFTELLVRFQRAGMQLLPSLVDFHFCFAGTFIGPGAHSGYQDSHPIVTSTSNPSPVAAGRSDVLNDPAKRRIFLDTVLGELLRISQAHRAAIFAWEVMNEPEWATIGLGRDGRVTQANMVAFLNDGIARIDQAGFRPTVGFANFNSIRHAFWRVGPLSGPQFHYYGAPPRIPEQPELGNPPAFIGEFDLQHSWAEWPAGTIRQRLELLQRKVYPLAMIWPDLPDSTPRTRLRMSDATQADVLAFTGGRP